MRGSNLKPGEEHPRAKLRNSEVVEIRREYRAGEKQMCLAKEYGVSQPSISKIVNRIIWGHLDE